MRAHLLRWQWDGYSSFHRNRINLLIHIVAVPAFVGALVVAAIAFAGAQWVLGACAVAVVAVAFVAQGIGHKREPSPPIPFDGALDALTRILAEQFITFPRFVLTGAWRAALRRARSDGAERDTA
jgi:uncharacterized membrane protein YGL010W